MGLKLAFAINYCQRDAALAQKSAAAVQAIYPDAHVISIDDSQTKLKFPPNAGQWTERWMQQCLATDADAIIKIDPDTLALIATSIPSSDVFGQMAPVGTYFPKSEGIICGGAIGFQRAAAQKILDSGFLRDAKYNEKPYACEERRFGTPRLMVILNDPIMSDISKRLGLSEGVWEGLDLMMSWEPARPFRKDATFAHPVKA